MSDQRLRLRILTEAGVFLACSLALSQIRLFTLPNGGTVSLSAFPIMLFSARRGWGAAVLSGGVLGLLVMALGPVVVHPLQGLLDYPLAHAALGLAGFIRWENTPRACAGVILAGLAKLMFHVGAGYFFLAGKGLSIVTLLQASFLYNLSHQGPEIILCRGLASFLVTSHPESTKSQASN